MNKYRLDRNIWRKSGIVIIQVPFPHNSLHPNTTITSGWSTAQAVW